MAKKAKRKSIASKRTTRAAALPRSILFRLSKKQQAAMKKCLDKNGRIKFRFKEVTITRLPVAGLPRAGRRSRAAGRLRWRDGLAAAVFGGSVVDASVSDGK
jgi:hypothetical protein